MPTIKGDPDEIARQLREKGLIPAGRVVNPVLAAPGQIPRKYRNKPTELEGFRFDSRKEANRWLDLREQQRAGLISDLTRQVEYPFVIHGVEVCSYVADFRYRKDGAVVVEDVKSPATRRARDYRIKVKLMKALYQIEVREV